MHELDRALNELEAGYGMSGEFEQEYDPEYESEYDGEWTSETDTEAVFDEVEEMELAAALLEISDEQELEEFLGKLIKKAGKAVGGFVRSPIGKALGGVLKNVARTALPVAGAALGNLVVPGVGGAIGGKLASMAGQAFGLELEGLSPQDQEFEVARRYVRLAGESVRQAAQAPATGSPTNAAKDAVLAAAKQHAPGLLGSAGAAAGIAGNGNRGALGGSGGGTGRGTRSGRWIRRGNRIVLFGA